MITQIQNIDIIEYLNIYIYIERVYIIIKYIIIRYYSKTNSYNLFFF